LLGAKNYVSAENFVIIEAIARRKAHYSWRDENIWRGVATEVSNSTAHERTPAQISDHFKKMVTAVRSAITELFVNTKLTWPARNSIDDEETLQTERVLYVSHLLNLMTAKGSSKKFFSRNWWSESVLLRLVELINSDEGRDYGIGDMSDAQFEADLNARRATMPSQLSSNLRAINPNNYKRKRDEMDEDVVRIPGVAMEHPRMDILDEAIGQINYTKHLAENLAQSLSTTNSHQKILEARIKDLEDLNHQLKHEVHQFREVIEAIVQKESMGMRM
jgi:hypothetical protein